MEAFRMKRALRASLVAAATAAVLIPIGVVGSRRHLERELAARVGELRTQSDLPEPDPRAQVWSRRVVPHLAGLDRWLTAQPAFDEVAINPGRWALEQRPGLAETLAALDPYFSEIDAILADEPLESWSLGTSAGAAQAPSLATLRRQTNLLCGRAILAADRPGGSAEAIHRVEQALLLLDLGDDGSLIAHMIRQAMQGIVLMALRSLTTGGNVDAVALQRAIEPALARAADGDRCQQALRKDLLHFAGALEASANQRGLTVAVFPHVDLWRGIQILDQHAAVLDVANWPYAELRALRDADRSEGLDRWSELSLLILDIDENGRVEVARAGLALAAHRQENGTWPDGLEELDARFQGDAPRDPRTGLALEYLRSGEHVWIAYAEVEPYHLGDLHYWEWVR
jgi:hypothetical protein